MEEALSGVFLDIASLAKVEDITEIDDGPLFINRQMTCWTQLANFKRRTKFPYKAI
jgi:hypothetical protein